MNAEASRQLKDEVEAVNNNPAIHQILEVVCKITGLGFAAVACVTETQWIACAVKDDIAFGLESGGELPLETTLCNEVRQHGQVVTIDEVATDQQYCSHPVPMRYGFQSYIAVPIVRNDGTFFGTLCGIDPRPLPLGKPETVTMFKLFGQTIAMHLDSVKKLEISEARLEQEREEGQLRDRFMAVLGHDLRNPLGAIYSCSHLLKMVSKDPEVLEVSDAIDRSVKRMTEMIESVLDMARARLGTGINTNLTMTSNLGERLEEVVSELRLHKPEREIDFSCLINEGIFCDPSRLSQMLSNLLANALTHGEQSKPVRVTAYTAGERFVMFVENEGRTIPQALLESMFKPFTHGQQKSESQGLGLGLYICNIIAEAHGGNLTAESSNGVTRFTFVMPLHGLPES